MTIERKFLTFDEAAAKVGGQEILREQVEFSGLCAFIKVTYCKAFRWDKDSWTADSLAKTGSFADSYWIFYSEEEAEGEEAHYRLFGWFELTNEDSLELVNKGGVRNLGFNSYVDGEPKGTFATLTDSTYAGLTEARFSARQIDELLRGGSSSSTGRDQAPKQSVFSADAEVELGTRERHNLLRIIAAVAKEAGIDVQGPKAVGQIDNALVAAGFEGPKEKTIRAILDQVRNLVG